MLHTTEWRILKWRKESYFISKNIIEIKKKTLARYSESVIRLKIFSALLNLLKKKMQERNEKYDNKWIESDTGVCYILRLQSILKIPKCMKKFFLLLG